MILRPVDGSMSPGGRVFTEDEQGVLVGSFVAQKTGVKVGDTINPYHGLQFDQAQRHKDAYTVVGILQPSNSPSDRVVWIPIMGIYRMSGHVLRGTGKRYRAQADSAIPEEHREVSGASLQDRFRQAGLQLDGIIRMNSRVTLRLILGCRCDC